MWSIKSIFIGGVPHQEESYKIHKNSIGLPQFSSETFQKAFFEKLGKQEFGKVDFISLPYTGVLGIHTRLHRYKPVKQSDGNIHFLPFLTYPLVYSWSRERAIKKCIKKAIGSESASVLFIYVYAIHLPFIKAALKLKRHYGNNIKLILIIPDLPKFTDPNSKKNILSTLRDKIKFYLYRNWRDLAKSFDGFIVFSDGIAGYLGLSQNYFTLLGLSSDGVSNVLAGKEEISDSRASSEMKVFVYAGGLNFKYGLKELVDGVIIAHKEGYQVELVLCGTGDAVSYIEESVKHNACIKYYGVLSREEVLKLERDADFLVNPRPSTSEFVKYSFPSKMFEYSMQAKPIIGFRLPPYPQSLLDAMIIPESENAIGIAKSLMKACELSELEIQTLSKNARIFFDTYTSDEYFKNGITKLLTTILNKE